MHSMRRLLTGLAVAVPIAFAATSARAVPVDLELALLVDVSGSVNTSEYNLQKTGYINAFRNTGLISAIQAGTLGSIAVTYIEWSGGGQQSKLVDWTQISDATTGDAFADAIDATSRAFDGSTAPGSAINEAVSEFSSNGFDGTRQVIDVSGDGQENDGADTPTARDAALAAGIDALNGLAIGGSSIETWYQDNIQGGTGSFVIRASDFEDFEAAVLDKLEREITGVPEPSVLAIMGTGLLGLGFLRRRAKKA